MPRPISAILNLSALSNNLKVVRHYAPKAKIWSVIKANAYGHGLARVWQSLATTDGFALLDLNDAIFLREQGWQKPILLLEGFFEASDLPLLDRYRLTTTVHNAWQLATLKKAKLETPLDIYLKLNSGMNRLGFSGEAMYKIWQEAKASNNISKITLMSHFANADNTVGIQDQYTFIEESCKGILVERSLANSAAILWHPSTHYDWVRPGIILYGASPNGHVTTLKDTGLRPVMSLHSKLLAVQTLEAGAGVGYGNCYHTKTAMRIGIVACGYADGYPRHAPQGTPIIVDGILTHTIGAVSMDMLAVDLTPCPQAGINSKVELWGENLSIDEVAAAANTIGYELMCALAARVPVVSHLD
ncbi:catabolic alanine racemase DadX [Candidatus Fukatsuia endosymbiont of Tuberolachnus salignus]|uniref:catabolic alanine racemase DadX n=1 Tax=Candidatus Fukatsuia endosymbiont of Tuberolachnus salignus TaxID=3077957 RepID=UPI00313EC762